jgi:hypothetical protein
VLQQLQIVVWGWNFLLLKKLFAKKFFLDWAPDILTDLAADFVEDRQTHTHRDIHIETDTERETST